MTIISQDEQNAINYDNCTKICVNGVYIHTHTADGQKCSIGCYESEERTMEVFRSLLEEIDKGYSNMLLLPEE